MANACSHAATNASTGGVPKHERVHRCGVPKSAGLEAVEEELTASGTSEDPADGKCVDRTADRICQAETASKRPTRTAEAEPKEELLQEAQAIRLAGDVEFNSLGGDRAFGHLEVEMRAVRLLRRVNLPGFGDKPEGQGNPHREAELPT
ncbi:unnamed protein product [Peronospora belbahrii]|uniref:Uncharacterized protein n=1 Tax=Peronospora belbahrii TaxID=622444 RepID=A0ABN8CQU0_9STRA|nr:unnamed protein product [Peronospora belbahrii]